MFDLPLAQLLGVSAPLWPSLAAVLLGLGWLLGANPRERTIVRVGATALVLSLVCAVTAGVHVAMSAAPVVHVPLTRWFHAGAYHFDIVFTWDRLTVALAVLAASITGLIGRFSVHYLHREPGFLRFFILLLVFAGGMQLLLTGGSYDVLFIGWEMVGLTSTLLIGFFHERTGPVRASMRAFILHRLCDVGLLVGAVMMHQAAETTDYAEAFGSAAWPGGTVAMGTGAATAIALLMMLAAMGASAIYPVGNWLPRAMEGPTPSSALFYCALSVHTGVYLMLRSVPLLEKAPLARVAMVVFGLGSAWMANMGWRVRTDAKGALAYASMTQTGWMFAEIGLGLYWLATVHLVGHACLRGFQMLRAPSTLEDALQLRAARSGDAPPVVATGHHLFPAWVSTHLWRAALEHFYVGTLQDRVVVGPILHLGRVLDQLDRIWLGLLSGTPKVAPTPSLAHQDSLLPLPSGTPPDSAVQQ